MDKTQQVMIVNSNELAFQLYNNKIKSGDFFECRDADSGSSVPVKILHRPQDPLQPLPLVICFHGSVNREKMAIPVFEGRFLLGRLAGLANVVSISDPSLARADDLRACWYAGDESHDVPKSIRKAVSGLIDGLNPKRVIFVGGSTGGHAALLQSLYVPGSIAIVENPILLISKYHPKTVADYRSLCWPKLAENDALPSRCNENLAEAYADAICADNLVVYLQNSRDHHLFPQTIAFLHAIGSSQFNKRLMLIAEFFKDYPGHSYPAKTWASWVWAACKSNVCSLAAIAELVVEEFDYISETAGVKRNRATMKDIDISSSLVNHYLGASRDP